MLHACKLYSHYKNAPGMSAGALRKKKTQHEEATADSSLPESAVICSCVMTCIGLERVFESFGRTR